MTIPMPEPVAWVRRHPDGALTAEFLEDAVISPVRKESGAWLPMVTTTQAEAYADARVRQALEDAISLCWTQFSEWADEGVPNKDGTPSVQQIEEIVRHTFIERAIRALIPQQ